MYKIKVTLTSKYTPSEIAKLYKTTLPKVMVQLNKGIKTEGEHTKNKLFAKKISLDHLAEDLNF